MGAPLPHISGVTSQVRFYERRDDGKRSLLKTVEVPTANAAVALDWAARTLAASDPELRSRIVEVRVSFVETAAPIPARP
jgi:hypothetical protein